MFIIKNQIKNFRLFSSESFFEINDLNIPVNQNEGSGLTIFVGENGCGKTSLLDALALPYIEYKADSFSLDDMNNPDEKTEINIYTNEEYYYKGTLPKSVDLRGKGLVFTGGIHKRATRDYLSSIIVTDQQYIRADGMSKLEDNSPLKWNENEVSIHTFLRNLIHHQADNGKAKYEYLLAPIRKMREYLVEIN